MVDWIYITMFGNAIVGQTGPRKVLSIRYVGSTRLTGLTIRDAIDIAIDLAAIRARSSMESK